MLIGLCGKSGTGKSTIANALIQRGYKKVVTDTTRPPRKGEVNGVDYWFDSDEQFDELYEEGEFIEVTSYKVANGDTWRYGTTRGQLKDAGEDAVIILNPDGVKAFRKKGIPIYIWLVDTDYPTLKKRLEDRGDNKKEIIRRMQADERDFKDIEKFIDDTIKNNRNSKLKDITDKIIKESVL